MGSARAAALVNYVPDEFVHLLRNPWISRCTRLLILLPIPLGCLVSPARRIAQESAQSPPALTAQQIVSEMVSRNTARAAALPSYTVRQICRLTYRGFPGDRSGEMILQVEYTAGSGERYTLVSQSGSKFIIDHVLKRLLRSEQEAQSPRNREETALTPRNYNFDLLGEKTSAQGRFYVLRARPKIDNKFLFRGEVWVDAADFAVARIVAEPAKNPSFWITHTRIKQEYTKIGSFWLPLQNTAVSKIRVFDGTATLLIQYQDYSLAPGAKSAVPGQAAGTH